MIDLATAYEIRDVLDNKVIDSIIDEFGNVWYETFRLLPASGVPPITLQKCKGVDLVDYKIYGNSVQNETPTVDAPIEIESVGDYDEETEKYKIPVLVSPENLLDLSQLPSTSVYKYGNYGIKQIRTSATNGGFRFSVNIPAGSQIYLSYKYVESYGDADTNKGVYLRAYNKDGERQGIVAVFSHVDGKNYIRTCNVLTEDIVQLEFYTMSAWAVGSYYIIDNVKITYEKPITTNIYLNEPLRKISNSETGLTFTDYIDFEKKQVIRKIYNEFITNIYNKSSSAGTYNTFLSAISKKPYLTPDKVGTATTYIGYAISNKFRQNLGNYVDIRSKGGYISSYTTTGGDDRVAFTFASKPTTVEEAQTLIGEGFDVCYVLDEEEYENIELPNISTFKGTSIIEVDTNILPSNMKVEYYGKDNKS